MEARIARAAGNPGRALRALERAQEQVQSRGGATPVSTVVGTAGNPFQGVGQGAGQVAGQGGGMALTATPGLDPVAEQVARELASVREEAASRIQGALAMRFRSGTAGTDRLSEVSAPVVASLPAGSLGGRFSATVAPVTIGTGTFDNSNLTGLRSFGTNVLVPGFAPAGGADGRAEPGDAGQVHAARRHRDRRRPRRGL